MTECQIIWLKVVNWCWKHRKNCKCCPVSQLIVRSQRLSWIQVLNCQNCSQCLKCHKSLGLLLGGVLKMSLSLSLSFSISLVMSCLLITLNKCLKGHKSLGLLSGGALKMSLSLSLSEKCILSFVKCIGCVTSTDKGIWCFNLWGQISLVVQKVSGVYKGYLVYFYF